MSDHRTFRTPYPDYDVLDKWNTPSWNDVTRRVVGKRLREIPERRFFSEHEWRTLEAVCDRLVPQPDRPTDPVPLVPWIDEKLHEHRGEGYRYFDMPPMEEAWRKGLRGIDEESQRLFGRSFLKLPDRDQDAVLEAVQKGDVKGPSWEGMNVKRFFSSTLLKEVVSVYYAHPAAWSEIGFGGPASPRGYVRLGMDSSDPWEAKERKEPEPRR
jgi:hypothetical protein